MLVFNKDFTQQEAIPDKGIEKALEVLRSGRLHRYNLLPGEKGLVCELEEKFSAYMGTRYCLACASCGSALFLALKSVGVRPGDKVLWHLLQNRGRVVSSEELFEAAVKAAEKTAEDGAEMNKKTEEEAAE